jgi:hypothetical protein
VKRCVSYLVCLLIIASVFSAARADDGADQRSYIYSVGKTGRVGIGTAEPATTLDVSEGEVKIGSTGAGCAAGLAGAIRYADKNLQFCDGEGWRSVSTASDHP